MYTIHGVDMSLSLRVLVRVLLCIQYKLDQRKIAQWYPKRHRLAQAWTWTPWGTKETQEHRRARNMIDKTQKQMETKMWGRHGEVQNVERRSEWVGILKLKEAIDGGMRRPLPLSRIDERGLHLAIYSRKMKSFLTTCVWWSTWVVEEMAQKLMPAEAVIESPDLSRNPIAMVAHESNWRQCLCRVCSGWAATLALWIEPCGKCNDDV